MLLIGTTYRDRIDATLYLLCRALSIHFIACNATIESIVYCNKCL